MKSKTKLLSAGTALLLFAVLIGCGQKPGTNPVAGTTPFKPTVTLQELMISIIDPSADGVWNAVSTEVSKKGAVEIQPRTDEEWQLVRNHAVTLIEASNLLLIEGRRVAPPGTKSVTHDELEPEEIQKRIDANRTGFNARAHALHAAVTQAIAAIDAKKPEALTIAGWHIENSCEACHQQFWYPGQVLPTHPNIKK